MKAFALLIFLGVVGCTDRSPETAVETPRERTVFDPMISTIDRAEGVEQTLQDSAAERRRQIEEAEAR